MHSLLDTIQSLLSPVFAELGAPPENGRVRLSDRPDLGQFQCNGAMPSAGVLKRKPLEIAEDIAARLRTDPRFAEVSVTPPGFLNLTVTDAVLAEHVAGMAGHAKLGFERQGGTAVLDFGGLNVAKAMHVGHLRSLIVGDCLQRLFRFCGDTVVSDVHLGDWGLQMGMLIAELAVTRPDLPYFDPAFTGPYPKESPVTLDDLQEIYPQAATRCKEDPAAMEAARLATRDLQLGRPGYRALWQHFVDVSRAQLEVEFDKLGIVFDLWEGESTVNDEVFQLVEKLEKDGTAIRDDGALIVPVEKDGDKKKVPPLLLLKSDGAMLYASTDLATIQSRVQRFDPDTIVYVVDQRQHLHFEQVFRCAQLAGIVGKAQCEHVGFGTINGPDGKPFKTRAGGTMKLGDMLDMARQEALARLDEAEMAKDFDPAEREAIAARVGMASIKFADLVNPRLSDYVFDLARFTRFEGKTGPYVLYAAVRIKSILRKAADRGLAAGAILPAATKSETGLMLQLGLFSDVVASAYEARAPHFLCTYAHTLAQEFNRFYHECQIISEPDAARQASYLALVQVTLRVLEQVLDLLGIPVVERM